MKNIQTLEKYLGYNFLLLLIFLLISINTFGQTKSEKSEIKGKENTYSCKIITRGTKDEGMTISAYYVNTKYNLDEIHKQYKPSSPDVLYIWYKINNHDKFIKAFYKTFNTEKIGTLSKIGIRINTEFILDKNGSILALKFCLIGENNITPFEIELLEKELLGTITFKPMDHPEDAYPRRFVVRTNFKEIEEGEIKRIRKNEKRNHY